jgi:ribosomal protein S18 acetylase RimI-like enzyme
MSLGPSVGYASLPLPSNLRYRSIEPRDLEQIKAIHLRLFPVQYSDEFFERAVRGVGLYGLPLMTSIAYYIKPKKREPIPSFMKDFSPAAGAFRQEVDLTRYTQELAPGATSMAVQGRLVHSLPNDDVDDGDDDEEEVLVGFIFSQLLGSDRCADDVGDAIDLSSGSTASSNHADYFGCYILTLGVLPEYRRGGLGQTLVHQAIQSATNATAKCALVSNICMY